MQCGNFKEKWDTFLHFLRVIFIQNINTLWKRYQKERADQSHVLARFRIVRSKNVIILDFMEVIIIQNCVGDVQKIKLLRYTKIEENRYLDSNVV